MDNETEYRNAMRHDNEHWIMLAAIIALTIATIVILNL